MLLCIGFGGKLKVNCPDYERLTDNPEVIGSSFGLVPTNAFALTGLATFRVVDDSEVGTTPRYSSDSHGIAVHNSLAA